VGDVCSQFRTLKDKDLPALLLPQSALATKDQQTVLRNGPRWLLSTIPTAYNHGIQSVRPISGYGVIDLYQSVAKSGYNAMWLTANGRCNPINPIAARRFRFVAPD
jgi:hypothetical protein